MRSSHFFFCTLLLDLDRTIERDQATVSEEETRKDIHFVPCHMINVSASCFHATGRDSKLEFLPRRLRRKLQKIVVGAGSSGAYRPIREGEYDKDTSP